MFAKKVFLILACIASFLATALASHIPDEFDSGDSSTWTTPTHNNESGNCMGEDFIKCYENILEYVTLGEEKIKISDEKNAVVVIGLTRVGKSTLTQVIANETNPLFVSCAGTICQLIDDSGDGSNSVVSKTFVPNTVEDETTNGVLTPFYDMPGFDDTRNISIEIANSFFIQKVINNIEKIKIVVVAKHASFSSTETTFKTLLTFLTKVAKDPAKFKRSILIISNFGMYGMGDSFHFQDMRNYMVAYNESMYGEESSHPNPDERASAAAWINCFLDSSADEPENLLRAAVFRSPTHILNGTSIRNDSIYMEDTLGMKHLLWNETLFTPVSSNDIGFTLSVEAEMFLVRATRESDTSIRNNLNRFALRTKAYLRDFILRMKTEPTEQDMSRLSTYIASLHNLYFPDCKNNADSSPRECINQIAEQFLDLATEMNDVIFTDINKTTNYLQFAYENIGKEKEYNMEDWVTEVFKVWYETDLLFNNTAFDVASEVINAVDHLADDGLDYVMLEFQKIANSSHQGTLEPLNNSISEILNLKVFLDCSEDNPNSSPISCFRQITDKTILIREVTNNNIGIELQTSVTFLELACLKVGKCLGLENWAASLTSLQNRILDNLDDEAIPENISSTLLTQLAALAVKLKSKILQDVPNSESIIDLLKHLLGAKNAAEDITGLLENYDTSESLHGYAELAVNAYRDLLNASVVGVFLDGISVLERLKIFPWYSPAWISFHRDRLTLPLLLEWRVCEFQSLLFKNLGAANVQVDDIERVLQWRLENPELKEENFDQFWNTFNDLGIEAIRSFSGYREDIKGHISNNEYSRKWLNIVLDHTLKRDQINCPTVQSGAVKFERKYLALQFVYDCLKNYATKPTTIVALAEHTFFFDANFENLGISNKYKIFVMSRNFDYTRGQRISINGINGEPPSRKPSKPTTPGANGTAGAKGNDGKEGNDFIGVHLADIGLPSRVDITCQGGDGGNGQDGGDGANTDSTSGPTIKLNSKNDLDKNQCDAWRGAQIKVKIYPNTCNSPQQRCDKGSMQTICGDEPQKPGSKGIGGAPGVGGLGGFLVLLNVTSSTPLVTNCGPGKTGNKGYDGTNGTKGTWGAVKLRIGDRYCSGCAEYLCKAESSISDTVCHVGLPDNTQRNTSLSAVLADELELPLKNHQQESPDHSGEKMAYSLAEFKPYIKVFLDNAAKNQNVFYREELTVFLDFVKKNSLLV